LGTHRREGIVHAITNAKADVEDLTDFVLCLRELPRKDDLDWYFGLDVPLRLHLWADEEIETRLTGGAEILRRTYFGELVITADQLREAHSRMIEPVSQRWVPGLHVATPVEDAIDIALGRRGAGEALSDEISRLDSIAGKLQGGHDHIDDGELANLAAEVGATVASLAERLKRIASSDRSRETRELVAADATPTSSVRDVRLLARRLRARRSQLALPASTVEGDIRVALGLLAEQRQLISSQMIAVVGDAGRGKTQLSAQLTSPTDSHSAGIFLRGGDFREGGTLDELARRLPGINAQTFDELLEAVDAFGGRAGAKMPIVIDGLNDAERPAEWQTQLAQVMPVLGRYDNVLLIVTVRGAVREDALPAGALEISLEWEPPEVEKVVARYFEHYLINPGSSRLPMSLFSIPLFVRMFCEAVNPDRAKWVGVEAIPGSLVAVFELYRRETAKRLRVRPGHPTLPEGHIEKRLAAFAAALWEDGSRDLTFDRTRELLDGPGVSWDDSLVHALEDEGILFRESRHEWTDERNAVLFDRFGGYLIADTITRGMTMEQLEAELSSAELWAKLRGTPPERHPLAEDVLVGLIGLLPRRLFGRQLWRLAPESARDWVLAQTMSLESALLDLETVAALEQLVRASGAPAYGTRHPFDRLWEIRDGTDHKLNARFLDRVLRDMTVAQRDLGWTEWVRERAEGLVHDLDVMEARWVASDLRDDIDDLNARAIAWLLTSTSLLVRDRATRALQRFGRPDPARLFTLAAELLEVNDPYVTERLLAASFGAATAHQMPDPGGVFERSFRGWLEELRRRYMDPNPASPTSHQLSREYVKGLFELGGRLHPSAIPGGVDPIALHLAAGPEPDLITVDDERAKECDATFGMDFENYTIGSLYDDRGNYQMEHAGFVDGVAEVRGRIWDLGWRSVGFADPDRRIAEDHRRRRPRPDHVERYGKKYGWIGYYELAGRLDDRGLTRDRSWTSGRGVYPDIDPTFPEVPPPLDQQMPAWASTGPADDATWVREAPIEIPDQLLVADALGEDPGPWVLVEGYFEHQDAQLGRRVWGFVRGVLADVKDAGPLQDQLQARPYLGNDFVPHSPEDRGSFAGEIPWSSRFETAGDLQRGKPPYIAAVSDRWDKDGLEIELLGHGYDIEVSRTSTNQASGYWVPSHNLAARFDLRQRPGKLDLVGLDGRAASVTRAGPPDFNAKLLYVRRDLLAEYAGGRKFVQVAWGEREVEFDWANRPDWLDDSRSEHDDLWRRVRTIDL
jgi:hypothetical protein